MGSQRSVPIRRKPGGMTPTISVGVPFTRIDLPTMDESPPKRDCQMRWLITAMAGPRDVVSSRRKLRQASRRQPMPWGRPG